MRKSLYTFSILMVLAGMSCKKGVNTSGGTWTFKNMAYHAAQANYINGTLTANTGSSSPVGTLAFYFPNGVIAAGSYTVTNNSSSIPPAAGYMYVQLTDSSAYNYYTVTPGATQMVTVTVSGGKATVSLPPVEMVNTNNSLHFTDSIIGYHTGTDSSLVSGTIIQTQ